MFRNPWLATLFVVILVITATLPVAMMAIIASGEKFNLWYFLHTWNVLTLGAVLFGTAFSGLLCLYYRREPGL